MCGENLSGLRMNDHMVPETQKQHPSSFNQLCVELKIYHAYREYLCGSIHRCMLSDVLVVMVVL